MDRDNDSNLFPEFWRQCTKRNVSVVGYGTFIPRFEDGYDKINSPFFCEVALGQTQAIKMMLRLKESQSTMF